jgi:hypothetical protein
MYDVVGAAARAPQHIVRVWQQDLPLEFIEVELDVADGDLTPDVKKER